MCVFPEKIIIVQDFRWLFIYKIFYYSRLFVIQLIVCFGGEGISDVVPFSRLATDNGSKQNDLDSMTFDAKNDVVIIPYSSGTTGL